MVFFLSFKVLILSTFEDLMISQKCIGYVVCNVGPRVLQTYVVNFICQKVQIFWADSDYVGRINNKSSLKAKKFFYYIQIMQRFHAKKIQLKVGWFFILWGTTW